MAITTERTAPPTVLPKAPTGILGLDEITGGGLPRGRSTLVCGSAGCGKTMLAAEFLVRGASEYDEPGERDLRNQWWNRKYQRGHRRRER